MTHTIIDISNPAVLAIFLRAHLRCIAAGLQPSRGLRKGDLLAKAGNITGKAYGRSSYGEAISDLTTYINANRGA